MLENETFEFFFAKSGKEEGAQKIAKKICCLRRDAFVDDPKATQHPEAEILIFENYLHYSSRYHSKIIGHNLKIKPKNKCVCIHEIIRLTITKMKMKMKKRSHIRRKQT